MQRIHTFVDCLIADVKINVLLRPKISVIVIEVTSKKKNKSRGLFKIVNYHYNFSIIIEE